MKRPVRIEGDLAYLPISQGYEAIIDAADACAVARWNWSAAVRSNSVYVVRRERLADGSRLAVHLHRVIAQAPEGVAVDHINGNALDNRRVNLRLAYASGNQRNRSINRNNTSGFKGVSWDKQHGRWQAGISVNGRRKRLGLFDTAEEAHAAYAKAAQQFHGEFARIA